MKSNNIFIKVATAEDASGWANMLLKLDGEVEYTTFEAGERSSEINKYKDKIIEVEKDPKSIIFLAIDNQLKDNIVVGYLCIEAYKNKRKCHVATVGIGILKSHSMQGIANKFSEKFIKHVTESGLKRIEAHIAESNYKSINLAKRFGFTIEGIKSKAIRINSIYQDEYLMALEIDSYE
ncbi:MULTISPECIES: GNAT family N-acetyltransferase [Legionella]|uniref:GNAT family acetyltransferase n=1 Tax=Legionella drozanskii LLAP-1 TaxID=1212489 RepID=A0A0W0TC87_9GAMM|nr:MULTISPECIES: GNAT family protein [Legionella]KTC93170.1 GNAT family acetyltransferase [Legionella drozanskii LLAP-1]PJE14180.1 MAG: N-acetyltransferase [Legionella sp.]